MAGRKMVTDADREEISRGVAEGLTGRQIAERLGRDPSVVSRELSRHAGHGGDRKPRPSRLGGLAEP